MNKLLILSLLTVIGTATPANAYFQYEKYTEPKQEIKHDEAKKKITELKKEQNVSKVEKIKPVEQIQPVSKPIEKVAHPVQSVQKIKNVSKPVQNKPVVKQDFVLKKGSLQAQLDKFSKKHGYTLIWNASNDYLMEAETVFIGDYKHVINELFTALKANGILLRAIMYKNNVLEVKD